MAENPIEVFVAVYDGEFQASQALQDFQMINREGSIDLIDAAVIVHRAEGKVTFVPGTSAIIAIAEDRVIERLERGLEGYERIARHTASAEAALAIAAVPDAADDPEEPETAS